MKVSVLIPNYNNGTLVVKAVASALDAGEIVVYDDGSDGDAELLEEVYGNRITLIRGMRNNGLSGWNRHANAIAQAFRASTGDVICLLDGDDEFLPGKIERIRQEFSAHPEAGMIQHMTRLPDGRTFRPYRPMPADLLGFMLRYHCLGWVFSETSALSFRRDVFQRIAPALLYDEPDLSADGRIAQLAAMLAPVVTLPDVLGLYNHDPSKANHSDKARIAQDKARYRVFNRFFPIVDMRREVYRLRRLFSIDIMKSIILTKLITP